MKTFDYSKLIFLHFAVQRHMYFNNYLSKNYGVFYTSDNINDSMWNYFVPENIYLTLRNIDEINHIITVKYAKKAGIYLPTYLNDYKYIKDLLLMDYNYELNAKESWLVCSSKKRYKLSTDKKVVIVDDNNINDYLDVFIDAYGGEKSASSPYGTLDKEYIATLKETYLSKNHINFILYDKDLPVSITSLCTMGNYGGIYAVGTKSNNQGRGYAKYLVKYVMNYYIEHYNKYLFLQTEAGSKVEKFYKSLGFKKVFEGEMYTSKELINNEK